jgi:tetratricopeptide (TPR) repeat protein
MRSTRHGLASDLERAIRLQTQAVEALPEGHHTRAGYLADLVAARNLRYQHSGAEADEADLEEAIDLGEQAVAVCLAGHPDEARCLTNLGWSYTARFERRHQHADLDRAVSLCQRAVSTVPDDHHNRAGYLYNLVDAYRVRFAVEGTISRSLLLELVRQITEASASSPVQQARAADALGSLAYAAHEYTTAVRLFDFAVALLPSVPPREAGWTDQEHRLGGHSGLIADAVAAHCAIDDPTGAAGPSGGPRLAVGHRRRAGAGRARA